MRVGVIWEWWASLALQDTLPTLAPPLAVGTAREQGTGGGHSEWSLAPHLHALAHLVLELGRLVESVGDVAGKVAHLVACKEK